MEGKAEREKMMTISLRGGPRICVPGLLPGICSGLRGPWPDMNWKVVGDNLSYHVPVYALTHHARPPLEMDSGKTFYFVIEGIQYALAKA